MNVNSRKKKTITRISGQFSGSLYLNPLSKTSTAKNKHVMWTKKLKTIESLYDQRSKDLRSVQQEIFVECHLDRLRISSFRSFVSAC
ncbi:hypothetical protein Hanom_Chr14g01317571 [Helianthus anomalus]